MRGETRKLLEKARRSIAAAETLLKEGDIDFAVGRGYYAMFYIAEALLKEEGLQFRKHSAVHAAFGEQYVKCRKLDPKFHRWLLDAFDKRIQGDYGIEAILGPEDVTPLVSQAREFLDEAERYLTTASSQ